MRFFLALFLLLLQLTGGAQISKLTWSTYDTSDNFQLINFSSLTKMELEFANILPDFKDNRATDRISVSTATQKLTLLRKPMFKNGEKVVGQFEGQFKTFYELDLGNVLTRNYRARLLFTCRLSARRD